MASEKKTKAETAPKTEGVAKKEAPVTKAAVAPTETPKEVVKETAKDAAGDAKPEADKSAAPKNYSRGEGQKAVTQAYKDNWNAIYGNKAETKPRVKPKAKSKAKPKLTTKPKAKKKTKTTKTTKAAKTLRKKKKL